MAGHYGYSPFGQITQVSGALSDQFDFRFSSEFFDQESGLVYYNFRYYSPELGRWLSRDPAGQVGFYINVSTPEISFFEERYSFTLNNSFLYYDYLGAEAVSLTLGGIALWKLITLAVATYITVDVVVGKEDSQTVKTAKSVAEELSEALSKVKPVSPPYPRRPICILTASICDIKKTCGLTCLYVCDNGAHFTYWFNVCCTPITASTQCAAKCGGYVVPYPPSPGTLNPPYGGN